jgi:hypothetical protein
LPECFAEDVSDSQILRLNALNPVQLAYLEEILATARAASIAESWVAALEQCVRRNRAQQSIKNPLENRVRQSIKKIPGARKLWRFVSRQPYSE